MRAVLAKRCDPADYDYMTSWRLRRLIVYLEETRVQSRFDDLHDG